MKIITAIGNPKLNQKLEQEDEFEMVSQDISYKEGIIELLEKRDADILILSELLPGEIEIKDLIDKIKIQKPNIQIMIFLEKKNQEFENYLYGKGIYNIFYDNQIEIIEIIKLIKKRIPSKEAKFPEEENKKIEENRTIEELEENMELKELLEEKENRIICISGTSGVGKSIVSIELAKSFMKSEEKILIIDFDVLNNSLHTILGIKKYSEKVAKKVKENNLLEPLNIEELIMKVNHKIDLIAGISLLFDSQYQISKVKVRTILSELKKRYDVIIIDTSSDCFLEYTKEIIKNSNITIFMTEANLVELKKAKKLLNIYVRQWGIPQDSFYIVFNKYNKNAVDESILRKIFSGFFILGKLSDSKQYNLAINKNDVRSVEKKLQKEYSNIHQKLIKVLEIRNRSKLWKK